MPTVPTVQTPPGVTESGGRACTPVATTTQSHLDRTALAWLRQLLTERLFRFFVDKDDVLENWDRSHHDAMADDYGTNRDRAVCDGSQENNAARQGKGKRKARPSQQGRYQFAPLRLLEDRRPLPTVTARNMGTTAYLPHHAHLGAPNVPFSGRQAHRGAEVMPRDAIGQLLKCCWALIPPPPIDEQITSRSADGAPLDGAAWRTFACRDAKSRAKGAKGDEAWAIARAILRSGTAVCSPGQGDGRFDGVQTREGEALLSVVEFLANGACMEVKR